SPSAAFSSTTRPLTGEPNSTVALSVITSTMTWSSSTASPGFTSHLVISPPATPSPMSGSLKSIVVIVRFPGSFLVGPLRNAPRTRRGSGPAHHLLDSAHHALRVRHVDVLERVREGRVEAGHAPDRRLQHVDALLRHDRG